MGELPKVSCRAPIFPPLIPRAFHHILNYFLIRLLCVCGVDVWVCGVCVCVCVGVCACVCGVCVVCVCVCVC